MEEQAKAGRPGGPIDRWVLLSAAEHHMKRALDGLASRDRHVQLDSAIHAGAAVELIAKAVIARVDAALVLEAEDARQKLIDKYIESGLIEGKQVKERSPRSISASNAVGLARKVVVELKAHDAGARQALDMRNSAAHAAELESEHLESRVLAASEYVLLAMEYLGASPQVVFGNERYEQLRAQIVRSTTALHIAAEQKVDSARQSYRTWVVDVSPTNLPQALRRRDHGPQHGDVSDRLECPACENCGWSYWNVEVDVEYEGPGEHSVEPFLRFTGFQCPFCLLELNDEEWEALGLSPHPDPADVFEAIPDDLEPSAPAIRRQRSGGHLQSRFRFEASGSEVPKDFD